MQKIDKLHKNMVNFNCFFLFNGCSENEQRLLYDRSLQKTIDFVDFIECLEFTKFFLDFLVYFVQYMLKMRA